MAREHDIIVHVCVCVLCITCKFDILLLGVTKSSRNFNASKYGHLDTYTSSAPSPVFHFLVF